MTIYYAVFNNEKHIVVLTDINTFKQYELSYEQFEDYVKNKCTAISYREYAWIICRETWMVYKKNNG